MAQDDKDFFIKVQDGIRAAVDEAKFMLTVNRMHESTQISLAHDPVKSVELLADKFQLTENERGNILRQLFMQGDNSRYIGEQSIKTNKQQGVLIAPKFFER